MAAAPGDHTGHAYFGKVADRLVDERTRAATAFTERPAPAPFQSWCADAEEGALEPDAQRDAAARSPCAAR